MCNKSWDYSNNKSSYSNNNVKIQRVKNHENKALNPTKSKFIKSMLCIKDHKHRDLNWCKRNKTINSKLTKKYDHQIKINKKMIDNFINKN